MAVTKFSESSISTFQRFNSLKARNVSKVGAGYVAGGYDFGGARTSSIWKINFATMFAKNIAGTLSIVRAASAGMSGPTAGIVASGFTTSATTNTIDKMPYATETGSAVAATLTNADYAMKGFQSSVNGYVMGGVSYGTRIYRYSFSADTVVLLGTGLSSAKHAMGNVNSATHAYVVDGQAQNGQIEKFDFSAETIATLAATISPGRYIMEGFESATDGYVGTTVANTTVSKINFATDTTSNLAVGAYVAAGYNSCVSGPTFGMQIGGFTTTMGNIRVGYGYRLEFSDDSISNAVQLPIRAEGCGFESGVGFD